MPNFNKKEEELNSRLDKWLYFIKNLEDFQSIPAIFEDSVFGQAFEKASIANFVQADLESYEASLKTFRDNKAVYDYATNKAFEQGEQIGLEKGTIKMAERFLLKEYSIAETAEITGLAEEKIVGIACDKFEKYYS